MSQICLMYHDVYESSVAESGFQTRGAEKYKISLQKFTRQIRSIYEYCELKNIQKNKIILTFDDGGSSCYSLIAPVLNRYDFKGYFFITTSLIGQKGFLSSEEIKFLHTEGHFIGTHSHTHPGMLKNLPFHKLEEEWSCSVKILESIVQSNIIHASIPGGSYSKDMADILIANGIKYIFTSIPTNKIRHLNNNCEVIGRFAILNTTTLAEVMDLFNPISFTRFKQIMKWNLLDLIKSVFGKNYLKIRKRLLK
jgi:peptidoglycan/xylan/chitin deacetylase (PgdA/CDA1 family)